VVLSTAVFGFLQHLEAADKLACFTLAVTTGAVVLMLLSVYSGQVPTPLTFSGVDLSEQATMDDMLCPIIPVYWFLSGRFSEGWCFDFSIFGFGSKAVQVFVANRSVNFIIRLLGLACLS